MDKPSSGEARSDSCGALDSSGAKDPVESVRTGRSESQAGPTILDEHCAPLGPSPFAASDNSGQAVEADGSPAPSPDAPAASTMPTSLKISCVLYVLIAVAGASVGGIYALAGRAMPYHLQILALDWESIPESARTMHLALQNGGGAVAVAYSLMLGATAIFALARNQTWAKVAMPLSGIAVGLPLGKIVFALKATTQASVPAAPMAIGLTVFIAAVVLSFFGKTGHGNITGRNADVDRKQ